jgi:hypothetical protein
LLVYSQQLLQLLYAWPAWLLGNFEAMRVCIN